jgi:hypothetical protein
METQDIIIKTPDFKNIVDVLKYYRLPYKRIEFIDFSIIQPVLLEEWFTDDLKFALENVGLDDKEAFMSAFVIVPFLRKVWKLYKNLNLFSHVQLKTEYYTVIPDFLITGKTELGYKAVEKPLLVTVEAKYEKFNEGWFQAAMQMIAARQMNENNEIPIYGIVTTGDLWQFGKLENNTFYQHPISVNIEKPEHLTGVISYIFGECDKMAVRF